MRETGGKLKLLLQSEESWKNCKSENEREGGLESERVEKEVEEKELKVNDRNLIKSVINVLVGGN